MLNRSLKTTSLALAGALLAASTAFALDNSARYPYIPETDAIPASKAQPITRATPGPMMEYPDTDPQPASRYQRVTHAPPAPTGTMGDRVDLITPPPMHWR